MFSRFLALGAIAVLTVGDSLNDESLFNPNNFPMSVGAIDILEYNSQLAHRPTFITLAPEGHGFCELAQFLIDELNS